MNIDEMSEKELVEFIRKSGVVMPQWLIDMKPGEKHRPLTREQQLEFAEIHSIQLRSCAALYYIGECIKRLALLNKQILCCQPSETTEPIKVKSLSYTPWENGKSEMTSIFYQNWHGKTALLPIIQQSLNDLVVAQTDNLFFVIKILWWKSTRRLLKSCSRRRLKMS